MGIGLVLALTAALAYGASDFVGGTGSRRHSAWGVVLTGQVVRRRADGRVRTARTRATRGPPTSPGRCSPAPGRRREASSCTGDSARGRMGLVAPVSAVGAAVLPVLVGVALGERPTWLAWLGVLVALPGIWLVSRGVHGVGHRHTRRARRRRRGRRRLRCAVHRAGAGLQRRGVHAAGRQSAHRRGW